MTHTLEISGFTEPVVDSEAAIVTGRLASAFGNAGYNVTYEDEGHRMFIKIRAGENQPILETIDVRSVSSMQGSVKLGKGVAVMANNFHEAGLAHDPYVVYKTLAESEEEKPVDKTDEVAATLLNFIRQRSVLAPV